MKKLIFILIIGLALSNISCTSMKCPAYSSKKVYTSYSVNKKSNLHKGKLSGGKRHSFLKEIAWDISGKR